MEVNLISGLASPGPKYELPSSFAKAARVAKHPTLGPSTVHSLKNSRLRCQEVRFFGSRHMRELQGHFSPGPQYGLPSMIGGSRGGSRGGELRLHTAPPRPHFTLQKDPNDASFWRTSTMLSAGEFAMLTPPVTPGPPRTASWLEGRDSKPPAPVSILKFDSKDVRTRQADTLLNDPPFAAPFGSPGSRDSHGILGGTGLGWRENKVQDYGATAPAFGPPSSAGPLRSAFVQPQGPNSVYDPDRQRAAAVSRSSFRSSGKSLRLTTG